MAIEHQMIDSWKQFWSGEERIGISLCLLGIAFGSIVGIFSKDWAESFHSIEIFSYPIPPLISFGIAAGLAVQLVSVLLSWITLYGGTELYFTRIIQILIGIPMGVLIIFNIFNGYLVTLGFVIPYALDLILSPIVMIFVGWHTIHLLWFNAILLLPLYIVSTGIIWLLESFRSIV
jgi:hypothetical protein